MAKRVGNMATGAKFIQGKVHNNCWHFLRRLLSVEIFRVHRSYRPQCRFVPCTYTMQYQRIMTTAYSNATRKFIVCSFLMCIFFDTNQLLTICPLLYFLLVPLCFLKVSGLTNVRFLHVVVKSYNWQYGQKRWCVSNQRRSPSCSHLWYGIITKILPD